MLVVASAMILFGLAAVVAFGLYQIQPPGATVQDLPRLPGLGLPGLGLSGLGTTTGSATFTPTPATVLASTAQPVVAATNVDGDNSAAWNPVIQVSVPSGAVGGAYTATITHSVA